jgi:hypothetical protein
MLSTHIATTQSIFNEVTPFVNAFEILSGERYGWVIKPDLTSYDWGFIYYDLANKYIDYSLLRIEFLKKSNSLLLEGYYREIENLPRSWIAESCAAIYALDSLSCIPERDVETLQFFIKQHLDQLQKYLEIFEKTNNIKIFLGTFSHLTSLNKLSYHFSLENKKRVRDLFRNYFCKIIETNESVINVIKQGSEADFGIYLMILYQNNFIDEMIRFADRYQSLYPDVIIYELEKIIRVDNESNHSLNIEDKRKILSYIINHCSVNKEANYIRKASLYRELYNETFSTSYRHYVVGNKFSVTYQDEKKSIPERFDFDIKLELEKFHKDLEKKDSPLILMRLTNLKEFLLLSKEFKEKQLIKNAFSTLFTQCLSHVFSDPYSRTVMHFFNCLKREENAALHSIPADSKSDNDFHAFLYANQCRLDVLVSNSSLHQDMDFISALSTNKYGFIAMIAENARHKHDWQKTFKYYDLLIREQRSQGKSLDSVSDGMYRIADLMVGLKNPTESLKAAEIYLDIIKRYRLKNGLKPLIKLARYLVTEKCFSHRTKILLLNMSNMVTRENMSSIAIDHLREMGLLLEGEPFLSKINDHALDFYLLSFVNSRSLARDFDKTSYVDYVRTFLFGSITSAMENEAVIEDVKVLKRMDLSATLHAHYRAKHIDVYPFLYEADMYFYLFLRLANKLSTDRAKKSALAAEFIMHGKKLNYSIINNLYFSSADDAKAEDVSSLTEVIGEKFTQLLIAEGLLQKSLRNKNERDLQKSIFHFQKFFCYVGFRKIPEIMNNEPVRMLQEAYAHIRRQPEEFNSQFRFYCAHALAQFTLTAEWISEAYHYWISDNRSLLAYHKSLLEFCAKYQFLDINEEYKKSRLKLYVDALSVLGHDLSISYYHSVICFNYQYPPKDKDFVIENLKTIHTFFQEKWLVEGVECYLLHLRSIADDLHRFQCNRDPEKIIARLDALRYVYPALSMCDESKAREFNAREFKEYDNVRSNEDICLTLTRAFYQKDRRKLKVLLSSFRVKEGSYISELPSLICLMYLIKLPRFTTVSAFNRRACTKRYVAILKILPEPTMVVAKHFMLPLSLLRSIYHEARSFCLANGIAIPMPLVSSLSPVLEEASVSPAKAFVSYPQLPCVQALPLENPTVRAREVKSDVVVPPSLSVKLPEVQAVPSQVIPIIASLIDLNESQPGMLPFSDSKNESVSSPLSSSIAPEITNDDEPGMLTPLLLSHPLSSSVFSTRRQADSAVLTDSNKKRVLLI